MIHPSEVLQTIDMFDRQNLDVRTITMGISLLDCADADPNADPDADSRADPDPDAGAD